jgi:small subunit ribosomal protein S20
MANIRSAKKRIQKSERQRVSNRLHRSRMRTAVKKLRSLVEAGNAEAARAALPGTLGVVDSCAGKGVIHANTAARTKSRLTRAVARLG